MAVARRVSLSAFGFLCSFSIFLKLSSSPLKNNRKKKWFYHCKLCSSLNLGSAFLPLIFIIAVHSFPLLSLSRSGVDLLGHLDQADFLKVVLSEEPAGADGCCLCFSFLNRHTLNLLHLAQGENKNNIKTRFMYIVSHQQFTKLLVLSSPPLLHLHQMNGEHPPTPHLHHHRSY